MTLFKSLAAVAALSLLAAPAFAQDKPVDLKPYEVIWTQCQASIGDSGGGWSGWHNVFDGGYADSIEFYEGSEAVSAVVETQSIDAIVYVETTSCFRTSGELAVVKTSMSGPNVAKGTEDYPAIVRHGEIYFDDAGNVVADLGWISDDKDKKFPLNDKDHVVARDCNTIDWRFSVNEARKQIESVLGDIEGTRPAYTPNPYDWCAEAKFPK